jgi:phosphatidylglycerophosphate synthase
VRRKEWDPGTSGAGTLAFVEAARRLVPAPEHGLSFARIALAGSILCSLEAADRSVWVLPAVLLACLSDFFDGRIARARGAVNPFGRWVDNLCDILFLTVCFHAFAKQEVWSSWPLAVDRLGISLPLLALVSAFGTYAARAALCSWFRRPLLPSPLGHVAGVANYGLALLGAIAVYPGVYLPQLMLGAGVAGVSAINFVAILQNGYLLARSFGRRA